MKEKEYVMTDDPVETINMKDLKKLDKETTYIIRTEFLTGLSLSIVYFLFVFAVPALNWFKPDWAFARMIDGMSFSWFLTTVVAMAMAFIIAYAHTKLYERWERQSVRVSTPSKQTVNKEEEPVV